MSLLSLAVGAVAGGIVVVAVPKLYTWLKNKLAAAKAAVASKL